MMRQAHHITPIGGKTPKTAIGNAFLFGCGKINSANATSRLGDAHPEWARPHERSPRAFIAALLINFALLAAIAVALAGAWQAVHLAPVQSSMSETIR